MPVVRPDAYRERTAWIATYIAGTLKVSNMLSALIMGDHAHVTVTPAPVHAHRFHLKCSLDDFSHVFSTYGAHKVPVHGCLAHVENHL
mmetsp:Transcript_83797/g.161790  ORF Transcript_83797/g.161790 Transcript_83797/m.161790 type:complete len:88 (-) Transcript_83797:1130-1393(-)